MKDKRLYLFSGILFTALFSIFITTCEVGLGEAVDINAPTVSITYPPASSIIRNTFVLAGVCNDDVSVESVTVTVRNTERNENYGPYKATVSKDSWRLNLNQSGGRFNGWEMSDGRYVAEVYATDAAGRKSGVTSIPFDVDNTPPIFIVNEPGAVYETAPTKYGTTLKVAGTIADDHTVREMKLKVYDPSDLNNPISDSDWTEGNIETAGGTTVVFARYSDSITTELNRRFDQIYGNASGEKQFFANVETVDSAKEYSNPSETSNNTTGNSTRVVYKNDDVKRIWLDSTYDLDASKVKKIINGTYSTENEERDNDIKDLYNTKKSDYIYFSLNTDAYPTYKVFGFEPDENGNLTQAAGNGQITVNVTAGLNGAGIEPTTIKVYLFGPYDSGPQLSSDNLNKLYRSDVSTFETFFAEQQNVQIDQNIVQKAVLLSDNSATLDSSTQTYNYSVSLPSSIEANKYYYIAVLAKDETDDYARAEAQMYGFTGYSTNTPPSITWPEKGADGYTNVASDQGIVINTWTGNNVTTGNLEFSGKITNRDGQSRIEEITYEGTRTDQDDPNAPPVNISGHYIKGASSGNTITYDSRDWSFVLPAVTEEGKRYLYNITVEVKNDAGLKDSKSRKFYVDTKKPVVSISSITPHVTKSGENEGDPTVEYLNGTFNITGSVDEANLESVWYRIESTDNSGNPLVYTSADMGPKYTITTGDIQIDSTNTSLYKTTDKKPVNIVIVAKDKAGNIGSISTTEYNNNRTYNVDQETDRPVFDDTGSNFGLVIDENNLSPESDFKPTEGRPVTGNIFDNASNHKLIGMFEDDDGIQSIDVKVYESDGTTLKKTDVIEGFNIGTTTASFTYKTLPTEAGIYWVEIIATDVTYAAATTPAVQANRKTTYGPFLVAIDNRNPTFVETAVGTEDRQFVREDNPATTDVNEASITFAGRISDDWKLSSLEVSVSAADTLEEEQILYATVKVELDENGVWKQYAKNASGEWEVSTEHSIEIDSQGNWNHTPDLRIFPQGYMTYVFTARDKAGKTTTLTRNVLKDTTEPVFGTSDIIDPTATGYKADEVRPYITTAKSGDWYNTTTLNIAGGVKDNASGVSKVEYGLSHWTLTQTGYERTSPDSWTELSGTSSFRGTIANVANGDRIYLRATDVAGNVTSTYAVIPQIDDPLDLETGIKIDIGVPSIEVTSIDGKTSGIGNILSNKQNPISITGTATDVLSGITEILISVGSKDFTS
uniref:Ig-like domain repeat protein n=1 Tax=Treponema sp. TaxID=166 RepID=UPI00298ECA28